MASIATLTALAWLIAWGLAAAVFVIVLENDLLGFRGQTFPSAIARPQLGGWRKSIEGEVDFSRRARTGAIVEHEAIAVGGKHEGDIQRLGIVE